MLGIGEKAIISADGSSYPYIRETFEASQKNRENLHKKDLREDLNNSQMLGELRIR